MAAERGAEHVGALEVGVRRLAAGDIPGEDAAAATTAKIDGNGNSDGEGDGDGDGVDFESAANATTIPQVPGYDDDGRFRPLVPLDGCIRLSKARSDLTKK